MWVVEAWCAYQVFKLRTTAQVESSICKLWHKRCGVASTCDMHTWICVRNWYIGVFYHPIQKVKTSCGGGWRRHTVLSSSTRTPNMYTHVSLLMSCGKYHVAVCVRPMTLLVAHVIACLMWHILWSRCAMAHPTLCRRQPSPIASDCNLEIPRFQDWDPEITRSGDCDIWDCEICKLRILWRCANIDACLSKERFLHSVYAMSSGNLQRIETDLSDDEVQTWYHWESSYCSHWDQIWQTHM